MFSLWSHHAAWGFGANGSSRAASDSNAVAADSVRWVRRTYCGWRTARCLTAGSTCWAERQTTRAGKWQRNAAQVVGRCWRAAPVMATLDVMAVRRDAPARGHVCARAQRRHRGQQHACCWARTRCARRGDALSWHFPGREYQRERRDRRARSCARVRRSLRARLTTDELTSLLMAALDRTRTRTGHTHRRHGTCHWQGVRCAHDVAVIDESD